MRKAVVRDIALREIVENMLEWHTRGLGPDDEMDPCDKAANDWLEEHPVGAAPEPAAPAEGLSVAALRDLADDVAAHIWTDVLKEQGDVPGWFEDKQAALELILKALSKVSARPAAPPDALRQGDDAPVGWGRIEYLAHIYDAMAIAASRDEKEREWARQVAKHIRFFLIPKQARHLYPALSSAGPRGET